MLHYVDYCVLMSTKQKVSKLSFYSASVSDIGEILIVILCYLRSNALKKIIDVKTFLAFLIFFIKNAFYLIILPTFSAARHSRRGHTFYCNSSIFFFVSLRAL